MFRTPVKTITPKALDELKTKYDTAQSDLKSAILTENAFINVLVKQLMVVYRACRELAPDSQPPGWAEQIGGFIKDGLKIAAASATGAGIGALLGNLANKNTLTSAALGGTAGALCGLWHVKNEHQARENARNILALVEDVKGDLSQVEGRMREIASTLCSRFQPSIRRIKNDEDGIGKLAAFFATSIAETIPELRMAEQAEQKKLSKQRIISSAITAAIPDSKRAGAYKSKKIFSGDRTIKNAAGQKWPIVDLALRAPLWIKDKKDCFVRAGEKSAMRIKYPPQMVEEPPQAYYNYADQKEISAIHAKRASVFEENVAETKRIYDVALAQQPQIAQTTTTSSNDAKSSELKEIKISKPEEEEEKRKLREESRLLEEKMAREKQRAFEEGKKEDYSGAKWTGFKGGLFYGKTAKELLPETNSKLVN